MKRGIKRNSGIYAHLEMLGLLEAGTDEQIRAAKIAYWQAIRRAWKQQHRNENHSATISFSTKEQKLLNAAAKKQAVSVTQLIKLAALQTIANRSTLTLKSVAKIREALVLYRGDLAKEYEKSTSHSTILDRYDFMQSFVVSLLSNLTTSSVDY